MKAAVTKGFLVLFFQGLYAQISGVVVDENNQPIPYVNIWVENENIGTTTQSNGHFTLDTSQGKKLVFSAVGFESQTTTVQNGSNIIMKSVVYPLQEVVITKPKQSKELEIGEAKKIYHRQLSGEQPWIYGKLFEYDSVYSTTPFLKKIIFYSESDLPKAKLKIRIFDFNGTKPTEDLLEEDLIVTVKKGIRKNTVDVSKYRLRFPTNGIVIGLEWLIIEDNKYEFEYVESDTKKRVKMTSYAPSLIVNYDKREIGFDYSQGKWSRKKRNDQLYNKEAPWYNAVMLPAINVLLSN